MLNERQLKDLVSVGPAMLRLYDDLCRLTRQHDVCCLDVFTAAVAQARNPWLPSEQGQWWYWSRVRKAASGSE